MSDPHRIDFGICAYRDAVKLRRAVDQFRKHTVSGWRLLIVDNPADGSETRPLIQSLAAEDPRIVPRFMDANVGYAGAVNEILGWAETPYVGYLDHDAYVQTPGWDVKLADVMDAHGEVGWMFPGAGHYGFQQNGYQECLWSAGFCWVLRRVAMQDLADKNITGTLMVDEYLPFHPGGFDGSLGHHEEVDYMIRLRLAGWRIGCCPEVLVRHDETATRADGADHKPGGRIHDGVVRWMNKWNRYFCGDSLQYSMTAYDPRALRYTDWPPCALYLERMTLARFPEWNRAPRVVQVPGVGVMDAVEVLKPTGCYRGRAI